MSNDNNNKDNNSENPKDENNKDNNSQNPKDDNSKKKKKKKIDKEVVPMTQDDANLDDYGIDHDRILEVCEKMIEKIHDKYYMKDISPANTAEFRDIAYTLGKIWEVTQSVLDLDDVIRSAMDSINNKEPIDLDNLFDGLPEKFNQDFFKEDDEDFGLGDENEDPDKDPDFDK